MAQNKKRSQNLSGIPQEVQQDPVDGLKYRNGFIVDPVAVVMGPILLAIILVAVYFRPPENQKNVWIATLIVLALVVISAWVFYGSSHKRQRNKSVNGKK